jgi:hypothetical protein
MGEQESDNGDERIIMDNVSQQEHGKKKKLKKKK